MAQGTLESRDFDRYMSLSEKEARSTALAANDAFTAALTRAIGKGRETVCPGTFVDLSPTFARRIIGEAALSACGSPAAMCLDSGGAESMK